MGSHPVVDITQKDCALVDEGWRRFWAKRGGIPRISLEDCRVDAELKKLTEYQALFKKPSGARVVE